MSRDELMKADLLSEVLLLASGVVILFVCATVLALAITHTAAM